MGLMRRLVALERGSGERFPRPFAWIICGVDEDRQQARARYEAEHGVITGGTIVWSAIVEDRRCG